jgi:hypothetical protein
MVVLPGVEVLCCTLARLLLIPEIVDIRQNQPGKAHAEGASSGPSPQQAPERVAHTVEHLNRDPDPGQGPGYRPAPANGPEKTPYSEGNEGGVQEQEVPLEVGGNQAGHETGRRERLPKPAGILLD